MNVYWYNFTVMPEKKEEFFHNKMFSNKLVYIYKYINFNKQGINIECNKMNLIMKM